MQMSDYIENLFKTRHFSAENFHTLRDLIEDPILGRLLRREELVRHSGVPSGYVPIDRVHAVVDGLCVDHDGKVFKVVQYMARVEHSSGYSLVRVCARSIRSGDGEVRVFTVCSPGALFTGYTQEAPGIIAMTPGGTEIVTLTTGLYVVRANRWELPGSWVWKIKTTIKRNWLNQFSRSCWNPLARERQDALDKREDEVLLVVDVGLMELFYSERLHTHKNPGDDLHVRMLMSCASRRRELTTPEWVIKTTILYFLSVNERCSVQPFASGDVIHTDSKTLSRMFKSRDYRVLPLVGPVEFSTEDVCVKSAFEFNGNVELISSQGVRFDPINGLVFDQQYSKSTQLYIYGPVLLNGSVKYTKKSTRNAEAAFTRITNSREFETLYRDAQDLSLMFLLGFNAPAIPPRLREAARRFGAFGKAGWSCVNHQNFSRVFLSQKTDVRNHLIGVSIAWHTFVERLLSPFPDPLQEIEHLEHLRRITHVPLLELNRDYAEQPHPKLQERLLAIANIEDNLALLYESLRKVDAKVKYETAKVGKVPRQYITLGSEAALRFPDIPMFMKNAMSKQCAIGQRGIISFVPSPTVEAMDIWASVTLGLHNAGPMGYTFAGFYHSDDTHFTMRCSIGGVETSVSCGIDIKKCDLSHGPGLFMLAGQLIEEVMQLPINGYFPLFEQLTSNIRVRHPDPSCTDYALFRARHMMLYSGSVLTTYVNNVASVVILCSIYKFFEHGDWPSEESIKEGIIRAAALVGYDVSIDSFTTSRVGRGAASLPSETFLKHFPCGVYSTFKALKCLAPLLRNYGISDEPVPPTEDRERTVLYGITASYMPECLAEVFRHRGYQLPFDVNQFWVPNECYAQRYGITPGELSNALVEFFTLKACCAVKEPALARVLEVGYGIGEMG